MSKGPRDTVNGRMRGCMSSPLVKAIGEALFEAADRYRAEAHRAITTGSVSGRNHKPSKPGEPPMNDTGFLAKSIVVSQESPVVARVTATAPYAAALEFGSSKIAERPFMRPTREKVRPIAQRILRKRINDALRKDRRRNR